MTATALTSNHLYRMRRERALALIPLHPHAEEMLRLAAALAEVQADLAVAAGSAIATGSEPAGAAWVAAIAVPRVLDALPGAAPAALVEAASELRDPARSLAAVEAYLAGAELAPAQRFVARAAATPYLEARRDSTAISPRAGDGDPRLNCPWCDAPPQLSYFAASGEALVTGPRRLVCSRCSGEWDFPRMTCAACGEHDTGRLLVLADPERFPYLRLDACRSCERYLVNVDLGRSPEAVPLIDELVALPLDLHANQIGLTKVTPNQMGF